MNDAQKRQLYQLKSATCCGHRFPVPDHRWTGGEILGSHNFNHPCSIEVSADRLTVTGRDNSQEWVMVL